MLKFKGAGIVPGISRAAAVKSDENLPVKADVVVIGGGVLGCITALELAERGIPVVLCEKGVIGGEASGRAAGHIEYQMLSPVKMELITRAMTRWREMPERIGADIAYNGQGLLTLFEDEKHAEHAAAWLREAEGLPGSDARMITPAEIATIEPALTSKWHSALFQANGATIEPTLAAPAIAGAARRSGATVLQGCAVRAIECQAGRVTGVITERGIIRAGSVIIAGGVWSSMLAAHLDIDLPQMLVFANQISVEPVSNGPSVAGMTPAGYFRREPDGGYMFGAPAGRIPLTMPLIRNIRKLMAAPADVEQEMLPAFNLRTFLWERAASRKRPHDEVSCFEEQRILQPELTDELCNLALEGMRKYIPAFGNCRIRERYAGSLMTTLDNLGVISRIERLPGLFIGTGMLYGLTMSAAAGEALADLVTGNLPKIDLAPYRYERLIDGSDFHFYP